MKKILIFSCLLVCLPSWGYVMTQEDTIVGFQIVKKLERIIDKHDQFTPLVVAQFLEGLADKPDMTDRHIAILTNSARVLRVRHDLPVIELPIDIESEGAPPVPEETQAESEHHHAIEAHEKDVVRRYDVIDGRFLDLIKGIKVDTNDIFFWELFSDMIPHSDRSEVTQLDVVNDRDLEYVASVRQKLDDKRQWILTINIAYLFQGSDLITLHAYHTLVHEFAHILTLGNDQIEYDFTACETWRLFGGCLEQESYLMDFINTFWTDEAASTEGISMELYEEDPTQFVTQYAATNVIEDIAESFTYYVMYLDLDNATTAYQKQKFFDTYPELVELMTHMRLFLTRQEFD